MTRGSRPIGHDAIVTRLERLASAVRQKAYARVHHAYIFSGPCGVGKWTTARWWTTRLKCEAPDGCKGDCRSCRQIAAGSHPDVTVCEPEEKGKQIKIEQIRDLIRSMALRAQREGPRVALIKARDLLTFEAQSAMLKLLEEPPGTSIIIMVVENPSALLATVRSRCQTLPFGTLMKDELVGLITANGQTTEIAEQAAAISRGRAARALAYDPEALAARATLIGEFEELRGDRHADIEPLVTKIVDKKNPRDEWLETLFEWQIAKIEASVGCPITEADSGLRALLDKLERHHTHRLIDEAAKMNFTRSVIARRANAKLALRELLLDIRT